MLLERSNTNDKNFIKSPYPHTGAQIATRVKRFPEKCECRRTSAGEMVSAFAEENNLAVIVGTKTPGRLLSGSAFKVGHGYILGLPVAAYLTWQGRMLENNGIVPKFSIELKRDGLREGSDTQLKTAVQVVKAM
ncbi:MAG: hypothetical protein NVS1B11_01790 [Terriglobales bacterium]